jgi:DNA polymerase elongation subunit (family B)
MRPQRTLFDFDEAEPPAEAAPAEDLSPILYGFDPTERVVAAEVADNGLVLWRRRPDDTVERSTRSVSPWLLLTSPDDAPPGAEVMELDGEGFRYLCVLRRWDAYRTARMDLLDRHTEHIAYAGPTRAALTMSGITLFKSMSLRDARRMQVDIETAGLTPEHRDERILLIAVGDNRGLLTALEGPEPDILRQFIDLVQERDPDVIEGHNIHGFDLPYIAARCRLHGIRPALGRDGVEMEAGYRRTFAIGGIGRPLVPWRIGGRHVIDTFLAVQRFDWARGSLTGYGLKQVARALGIAADDRIELPREQMAALYRTDRERVVTYALQDIVETARLADLVTATEFYQTQMVPDSYGSSAISGTGEKINAIFIRAYVHARRAVPRPLPAQPYEGGYTALRRTGVIHRIVKADFESLYPSIMLASRICPRTDTLGVFLPALAELTRRRLDAKARAKAAEGQEAQYWDGLQGSFKVLINSFYGYLGAPGFNFNDPQAAAEVTRIGRELVQQVSDRIEQAGGMVIEIDTDGVYFVPPEGVDGEEAEKLFVAEMGAGLPEGIRLAFDGRYRTMVSVKTKNYVLLDYSGKRTFRGASLRSRADEPFGREFLSRAVDLLMEGRTDDLRDLYLDAVRAIQEHRVPIEKLARRERVTDKTFSSTARQRLAPLVSGMALGDYIPVYERADGSLGRVEDYRSGDENVAYYLDKLYKFAARLKDVVGARFDELIPQPRGADVVLFNTLDLFGDD